MKNLMKPFLALLVAITMLSACKKDVQRNNSSNVPSEFLGRTTDIQDEIALTSRNVSISVWDHGTIDGDIVSVYVNGRKVVDEVTLDGPDNKFVVNTTLDFNGYNYILLHAHNEGSISPNTASLEINDGTSHTVSLESDLLTSGVAELIVN